MENDRHEALVDFLDAQASNALRGILAYDEDGWEALRIREEFVTDELKDALADFHERLDDRYTIVREEEYEPLGEVQATVEIHEEGVLLHFRKSPETGVVVTLDRKAAHRLATFIDQCVTILEQTEGDAYNASAVTD